MVVTTENKKKSRGFLSGLNQLRVGDYKIAVTEIKAALGINNRNSFYAYRDGKIEPKVTQAKAVWKIQCKLPPKTKRFCPLVLK